MHITPYAYISPVELTISIHDDGNVLGTKFFGQSQWLNHDFSRRCFLCISSIRAIDFCVWRHEWTRPCGWCEWKVEGDLESWTRGALFYFRHNQVQKFCWEPEKLEQSLTLEKLEVRTQLLMKLLWKFGRDFCRLSQKGLKRSRLLGVSEGFQKRREADFTQKLPPLATRYEYAPRVTVCPLH